MLYFCKKMQMSSDELKLQLFRQIDAFDTAGLKEFQGVLLNYINSKRESSEWLGVNPAEQTAIEAGLKELDNGNGKCHQEVMRFLRKNYEHA
jgi:hypothetical protein